MLRIFIILVLTLSVNVFAASSSPTQNGSDLQCETTNLYVGLIGDTKYCSYYGGTGGYWIETISPAYDGPSGEKYYNLACHYKCKPKSSSAASSKSSAASSKSQCIPPQVFNFENNQCEDKKECTYPDYYSTFVNRCLPNPELCKPGSYPLPNGTCYGAGTDCPAGFHESPGNPNYCDADEQASSSSGDENSSSANVSSRISGHASSVSASQTGNNSSSGNDGGGGGDDSANDTLSHDLTDCFLTFGVDRCIPISQTNGCPNTYKVHNNTFCVLTGGSGHSSSGGDSGSGSGSSSAGECDPTAKSYDECMGRLQTPDEQQTEKIKNDMEAANNKQLDDYFKERTDDVEDFVHNGISFDDAPANLKSAVLAHVPRPLACRSVELKYNGWSKKLDCEPFEIFKVVFAWFLSISTLIYIFRLAVQPVER